MTRCLSVMMMIACTPLVLGACQVASRLNKLSVSDSDDSSSMSVETAATGGATQPIAGTGSDPASGGAGAQATMPIMPMSMMEAGAGAAALPTGGATGTNMSDPATMTMNSADASNNGATTNMGMPMAGTMAMNDPMPSMDTGLADPATAMGTPTTMINQTAPTAGAGGDVAPQGGAAAMQPPLAGSGATMPMQPADPMCVSPFPGGSCDTAPQCGCAAGQNCAYLVTLDIPTCVRAGAVGLNQHCDLTADCQLGLQCFAGACQKLCDPNGPGCDNGSACAQIFSGNRPITGMYTCNSDCNLVAPQRANGGLAACGLGLTCVWSGGGSNCVYANSKAGRHGELCEDSRDCAPGYSCMDSGTCARWCETAQDCPSGYRCEDTDTSVAGVHFGLCRPNCRDNRELSCETSPQCGCENGMACDYQNRTDSLVIRACRETGRTRDYDACDDDQECSAGTSCVGSRCSPYCQRDNECGAYASCIQVVNSALSSEPPIPGFQVCRRPCDPGDLSHAHGPYEACPSGRGCEASTDGKSWCHFTNPDAARGSSCTYASDCAIGDSCSSLWGCSQQCRTDSECAIDYHCVPYDTRTFAADVHWGICIPNSTQ